MGSRRDGLAEDGRGALRQRRLQAMDQMLHHGRADVQQAGQAEQGDEGREQRQEPVVGQAARGHGAPVEGELLHRALEGVLPACPAQFEGVIRAAGHRVLRRYRLRSHHVVLRLRARATPMTRMPAATRASGQSRRTAWFRLTRSDASAALTRALVFTSAALALAFTSALAASSSTVCPRRSRVCSISRWMSGADWDVESGADWGVESGALIG